MKKILSLTLALVMVMSLFNGVTVSAATITGTCGNNLTWTLDSDGLLTISGTGNMNYVHNAPWYDKRDSIKTVIIEDGVTSICDNAFYMCTSLTSIEIPSSVTSINRLAFYYCRSLASVEIPDGVISICTAAFGYCDSLSSIKIPNTVTSIEEDAFYGCISIEAIKVANENLKYHDKDNCLIETETNTLILGGNISTIPDYVTSIGDYAFLARKSLTSIEIPSSVTSIGASAFSGCTSLADIYYSGTKAKWNKITIGSGNDLLTNAEVHFAEISYAVSGTFKAFGDDTEATAIELLNNGEVVDTQTFTGNSGTYDFEDLKADTYTVRVSKTKHAPREYAVTVTDADITQDVEIWLYGDITSEGVINNIDVLHLNRKGAALSSVFDSGAEDLKEYKFKVANVTNIFGTDKVINNIDVMQINRKIVYLSSVFDRIA